MMLNVFLVNMNFDMFLEIIMYFSNYMIFCWFFFVLVFDDDVGG